MSAWSFVAVATHSFLDADPIRTQHSKHIHITHTSAAVKGILLLGPQT